MIHLFRINVVLFSAEYTYKKMKKQKEKRMRRINKRKLRHNFAPKQTGSCYES